MADEEDPMAFLEAQRAKIAALGDMQRVAQMQCVLATKVQSRMASIDALMDPDGPPLDPSAAGLPSSSFGGGGLDLCTTCFDSPCQCPAKDVATGNQLCTSCFDSPCSCAGPLAGRERERERGERDRQTDRERDGSYLNTGQGNTRCRQNLQAKHAPISQEIWRF